MKNSGISTVRLVTVFSLMFLQSGLFAQSYSDSLAQDQKDILSSIAPYEPEVRAAILDVSQYPQALVKIERIQARSSQSFQDMIEKYPREDQEKLYEAGRFPDIVKQLTENGKADPNQINQIIKDLPAETQIRLRDTYANHFDDLVKMNKLYNSSNEALDKMINTYPQDVQADFRKVVGMPDVIHLLTENIDLTVSLGEQYKADPNGVRQHLDSLSTKMSADNEKDLATYKQQVASDPKLQEEMKSAATEFSTTNDQPDNPTYVTNTVYDNYPYPYWYGYPYWYTQPIWYPRPFYYNTGFYYGAGGGLVVVGLPSRAYSSWFFGVGYNRYPGLYAHYNSYYNFHRAGYGNMYRGFNYSAREHFNPGYRGSYGIHGSRYGGGYTNNSRTINRTTVVNRNNTTINRTARNNQMHVAPSNYNSRGMQQFHATQYHSMGWDHVGGTSHPSGSSFHSSGGSSFHGGGGGGRVGGGGGGGGGHGGGRH